MEETELEEGEALFDDNDASIDIDPDTAFSYIDKRLQNVLGHFQKDFEGGVSAEILGPKYGGYGSFLPAQKQFQTVHSHTKTPQRALNSNKPRSPNNLHLESAIADSVAPSGPVLAVRPDVDSVNKHSSSLLVSSGETCLSKNENSKSNLGNPTKQRSLKVRIKVGSDKSARKNDAIYSGLGLLSPSSSTGNNPEDSDGPAIKSHDVPLDSPSNILREMTSSFVPGNRLLSPLNENLLCLKRMERVSESKCIPPNLGRKNYSSSVLGEEKLMEGKDASSRDKSEILEGIKYKNSVCYVGDEAPFSSDSVHSTVGMLNVVVTSAANQASKKDIPVKKRATKKDWINDQLFGPDFTSNESEQEDVKGNSIEHDEETKATASTKKLSVDSSGSDRIRSNMIRSVCKINPDDSKHETDTDEKNRGPKVPLGVGKLSFKRKSKIKGIQNSGFLTSKLVKENLRSGVVKDMKNAHKEIVKVRDTYKHILDTTVEDQNNRTKTLEAPTGIGSKHCELGAIKGKSDPRNRVSAEATVPPPIEVAPAAPPDNWVACDRCEKWRLLPVGIETKDLPDKWMCSMSTWLPGMNYCDICEDETTRVVQEINLHLISQNQNSLQYDGSGAISGLATANVRHPDHFNSNVNLETMVKRSKKSKSRPEGSSSSLLHTSHSSMDSQQHRQKRKFSSEANQPLLEKNAVNKSVGLHPSKLGTVTVRRHAANIIGKDVNEGDLKPKRLKSNAGSDHYDPSNGDHRPMDRLVVPIKRQTESTQLSMKSKLSDSKSSEKVVMHGKKRKLKDRKESQPYVNASESREDNSDIIRRKEKRLKTANTEVKESTAIKGKTMKIRLPGSKENSVDRSHEKNQRQDKHTKNFTSRPNLNDSERFLLSATSSSSKVSDSRRRPNLQERKGSPVGSVSSLPAAGKTISSKTGTEIPRKLLTNEDNKELHGIDASQKFCGKGALKHKESSKIRSIHMIKYDSDTIMEGATSQSDGRISVKENSSGKKISGFQRVKAKASGPQTRQEPLQNKMRRVEADVVDRSPATNPDIVGDGRQKYSNESSAKIIRRWPGDSIGDEKPFEEKLDVVGSLEVMTTVKKDLRNVSAVKLSKKTDGSPCSAAKKSESAHSQHPLSRSLEITNLVVPGHNVSKVPKPPRDSANQNVKNLVTDCGTGTTKDLGVLSFVKEYASSQTAMTAFRRAEESKDYADRIKISGFDYECKDAYFDSALKFLYAASLLETCSTDISKSKGVDPVNVYSTAAKLCKTCAQEYEDEKEMAAATLAYKCMEVVYMRIVYCKSLVTRQDLQTSLQMVNLGESPSSSASDVDNLNNQATMDKATLSKSIAPPGNHVVARNQANFLRLLDFTSDINLAMEASMHTQNAYSAASAIIEEAQNKEMIISVKRVVDFSFQDVKELVCLVQHAREAINRRGFRGNNKE